MTTSFIGADQNADDLAVAAMDPLRADDILAELPAANERADTAWMVDALADLIADFDTADVHTARAALRDLGFLAASLVRHDPDADLHGIEPTLLRLAAVADEVPRDTVYSYTTRNPVGPRRRGFLLSDEEHVFIDSVVAATQALNLAVDDLAACRDRADLDEDVLLAALGQVHDGVEVLRKNLRTVQRTITPDYFSHRLRPYFPTMDIGGKAYMGPGGAQMPLLVLDVLLLAPSEPGQLGAWHDDYLVENVLYLPPTHRAVCDDTLLAYRSGNSPLLRCLLESPRVRAEYAALLKRILRFRYPHRQVARANMAIRAEGSLGSGGYTVEALDHLIEITTSKAAVTLPLPRERRGSADDRDR
ncbi:monodechloroaminopyrrolnitrin synthase PrnB family protein [Micromonospora sp. AMSO12t]|uniref:monodechloroaminopyrrolnitrin synthase PrnB family protein n=1 Tax=unclassified Micromonospora TaxID=2617518 RepID=UPI001788DAE3|nr:monodechloroaminopyrrolnitrin synthase PrnB family protein [Micromonospora sp. AMSO12t]